MLADMMVWGVHRVVNNPEMGLTNQGVQPRFKRLPKESKIMAMMHLVGLQPRASARPSVFITTIVVRPGSRPQRAVVDASPVLLKAFVSV